MFDRFSTVAAAIGAKVQRGARSAANDLVGGATLSFEVHAAHPCKDEVYGLLARVRGEVNELWNRVVAINEQHPADDEERIKVSFYFGQNVDRRDPFDQEPQEPSQCSSASCRQGAICECGVCTIACVKDAICHELGAADAVCSATVAGSCSDVAHGSVCLQPCERQAQCPDSLACVAGACRAKSGEPRDAGPMHDAAMSSGLDAGDAGPMDGGTEHDGGTGHDGGSTQPPMAPLLGAGEPCAQSSECLARLSCEQGLCGHSDCQPAPADRPACAAIGSCKGGAVCHIDGTCIDPGKCDAQGMTTLAEVGSIMALQLTQDSIYLLDYGTMDALGNHHNDGAIQRMPIGGGTPETLVADLRLPDALRVDGDQLFWSAAGMGSMGNEELWSADRATGANTRLLASDLRGSWSQDASYLYYLDFPAGSTDNLHRVSRASAASEVLASGLGSPWIALVDSHAEYVLFSGPQTGIQTVPLTGSQASAVTTTSDETVLQAVLGQNEIFFTDNNGGDLHSVSKQGGDITTLSIPETNEGATLNGLVMHREHLYWEVIVSDETIACTPATRMRIHRLYRAPRVPGATELLVEAASTPLLTHAVSDEGLFWVQDGHLLRKPVGRRLSDAFA